MRRRPTMLLLEMAAVLAVGACTTGGSGAEPRVPRPEPAAAGDPRDLALLRRMTLQEKVNQLTLFGDGVPTGPDAGSRPPEKTVVDFAREGVGTMMFSPGAAEVNRVQRVAVTESRLGIPILFAFDIIHGYWTTFPVPLGMAATWDPEDARRMARISGFEGYADGQRWTFAPMLDHPLDPRWGRVVETFGEAPLLASDYAVATVAGFHGALAGQPGITGPADFGIATCVKHLAGYGASKGGKDYAYVDLSERAFREFHLPPFAAAIAAGAATIMPAFTTGLGGVPMSANRRVLRDIVRGELGFDGVIVSDYAAITEMRMHGTAADDRAAAIAALRDGTVTVDMQDGLYYAHLVPAVESGDVPIEEVDRQVLRVLALKRRLGLWENPYVPEDLAARVRLAPAHRAAALETARKSVVLMKNGGELPLSGARRLLVVGPLADSREDLLGPWSGWGRAEDAVSVLRAIRERAARDGGAVTYSEGCRVDGDGKGQPGDDARIAQAARQARNHDLVVAVVGEPRSLSGESRNRTRLDLPGRQAELVAALRATGKPLVVVLLSGRALAVPDLVDQAGALVHSFFPGIEGGRALADVLFGDTNPGGKQPVTWPRSVGQLPIHHYDHPNGRPNIDERGDFKAHWIDEVDAPLFPFGHGLSYTRFQLDRLEVPARVTSGHEIVIRVRLTNTGDRGGDETPQLYVKPRVASTVTARRLQGYRRVHLGAGESATVEFRFEDEKLAIYDPDDRPVVEPGVYDVLVGTSASGGLSGAFELVSDPARRGYAPR